MGEVCQLLTSAQQRFHRSAAIKLKFCYLLRPDEDVLELGAIMNQELEQVRSVNDGLQSIIVDERLKSHPEAHASDV